MPPAAEPEWIPYRENGSVKYMRADAEEAKDFTSTGATAKHKEPSSWASLLNEVGFVSPAPQLLQERYTDDSVIAAVVTNVVLTAEKPKPEEKKSLRGLFRKDKEPSTTRVVWMPRREYKRHFARDGEGRYVGTEPRREWTEEELEEEFGQYQKDLRK